MRDKDSAGRNTSGAPTAAAENEDIACSCQAPEI